MKLFVVAGLICLLALIVSGQTAENESDENPIQKITLAKNGDDGFVVEEPESIYTNDIPIFFYVDLKRAAPVLIKAVVIAVRAKETRPNAIVVSMSYKTKDGEIGAAFNAKPKTKWAAGDYRVDVYVDGKLVDKREFVISEKP